MSLSPAHALALRLWLDEQDLGLHESMHYQVMLAGEGRSALFADDNVLSYIQANSSREVAARLLADARRMLEAEQ